MITWRGIRGSDVVDEFIQAGEGSTYTDEGFISTSMGQKVAEDFAGIAKDPKWAKPAYEVAVLQILNPKGTKVLYPWSDNIGVPQEREVILRRQQQFKIMKIVPMKDRILIQVEAIDEGQK